METIIWAIGFPLLLFFIALGVGTGFAMTNSESIGFIIVKACFVAAAIDAVALTVYWALASHQRLPWNIAVPTLAAIIVIPSLVLGLQWIESTEASLSKRLFPGDAPTPALPRAMDGHQLPDGALKVFFGSNLAWFTRSPHTILQMAGEKMIEIDRDEKGVLTVKTLKIFDDRNNIIARIDDVDGFWVENSTRSKRPNPSSLVVFDHIDKEVLRVTLVNKDTLSISGTFRHPNLRQIVSISQNEMNSSGIKLTESVMGESGGADINIGDAQ